MARYNAGVSGSQGESKTDFGEGQAPFLCLRRLASARMTD